MRLTRREFLKLSGTTATGLAAISMMPLSKPIESLPISMAVSVLPSIQRDKSYSIKPPIEVAQDEDNSHWLPKDWVEFKKPGMRLDKDTIHKVGVPVLNHPTQMELPPELVLQTFTGRDFLSGNILHKGAYPSLGQFYNEDETQNDKLIAYSHTENGAPKNKPVKIVYAIAPATDNTGYVAWAPWRTTGNQVEYAIVIRLNPPVSRQFATIDDFYRWIRTIYAHEKVHIKQMVQRHLELMKINPNASEFEIDDALRDNLIQDEAEAYWAQLTYGSIRNPEWLEKETSPYGEDLRVPFKILKDKNIDPLSKGIKTDEQRKYETLWQYVIYAHTPFTYNNLVSQSRKSHPEYIPMMEQCFKEGLITEARFMEYLKAVDENRYNQYQERKKIEAYIRNTPSTLSEIAKIVCSPVGLSITGLASLAALKLFLMSRK